jgi:hypothetical protein
MSSENKTPNSVMHHSMFEIKGKEKMFSSANHNACNTSSRAIWAHKLLLGGSIYTEITLSYDDGRAIW